MKQEGIELLPNYRAVRFDISGNRTLIHCKRPDGSVTTLEEHGYFVVATGITADTTKLALDNIGLQLTPSGYIHVNASMETNLKKYGAEILHLFFSMECLTLYKNQNIYS